MQHVQADGPRLLLAPVNRPNVLYVGMHWLPAVRLQGNKACGFKNDLHCSMYHGAICMVYIIYHNDSIMRTCPPKPNVIMQDPLQIHC